MPLSGCYSSCGLVAITVVALLLLPSEYLVPEPFAGPAPSVLAPPPVAPSALPLWGDLTSPHFPPLDLFLTCTLISLAFIIYLFEWIQRKIMERRTMKLNQYLGESVERLRAWDARQEQVEATLRLVQNATAEYNLLLYLLLRQHRSPKDARAAANAQPSNCYFDKGHEDDLAFLKPPTIDTSGVVS